MRSVPSSVDPCRRNWTFANASAHSWRLDSRPERCAARAQCRPDEPAISVRSRSKKAAPAMGVSLRGGRPAALLCPGMLASATLALPVETACDTIAVGLFEGKGIPHDIDGAMQALVDSGEARPAFRHLAVTHAQGKRLIVVGLGSRDDLTPEKLRVAAAAVHERARDLGARNLCWELPHKVGEEHARALVEGTVLAAYRFDRYKAPSS